MKVSVVIPTRNAGDTLAVTLESVLDQTCPAWEAIIVDDGSVDDSLAVARQFAAKDSRFRVLAQPFRGVSAARNTGIDLARHEWVLFLDADDWLLPTHLERMTAELGAHPDLDAVHCGWIAAASVGTNSAEMYCHEVGDLFALLAGRCVFAIHACMVRRSKVVAVGGFDTTFQSCEDWDMWQRVARAGARFGAVSEVLAVYRMRPDSSSADGHQMLTDGMRVIVRGHEPDPRVPNPCIRWKDGAPPESLAGAVVAFACWAAGLIVGRGGDARPVLESLASSGGPGLDRHAVARSIFLAAPRATGRHTVAWIHLWPDVEPRIRQFLSALEERCHAVGLERGALVLLERWIGMESANRLPFTIGARHAVTIEVTETILGVTAPEQAERLQCRVELEGTFLGVVELPIFGGWIPAGILADAISAEFCWPILGHFFAATVYRQLRIERRSQTFSVWRGSVCLADDASDSDDPFAERLHDEVGWSVFLQEVWGLPEWSSSRIYDPEGDQTRGGVQSLRDGCLLVDVADDLADVEAGGHPFGVVFTVGGIALGTTVIAAPQNVVSAQRLRSALTGSSGLELCRAAVREAVLGRSMKEPGSLRSRLVEAAASTRDRGIPAFHLPPGVRLAPGSARSLSRFQAPSTHGVVTVHGRCARDGFGTSASRWVMLPGSVEPYLREASAAEEPMLGVSGAGEMSNGLLHAPDVLGDPRHENSGREDEMIRRSETTSEVLTNGAYGRSHFEGIFAERPDPWDYTSPYEQVKYRQTLDLLPRERFTRALELACAEGHFTLQLASHVETLVAADISQIALVRAAARCAEFDNVQFMQLDLADDALPGSFDLIVCSEVLYYLENKRTLRDLANRVAGALTPGGHFVTAHANVVVDEPDRAGFDWDVPFGAKVIGDAFASAEGLRRVKELCTPLYRIQLFQRDEGRRWYRRLRPSAPTIVEVPQPTELAPEVAERVLWCGGEPRRGETRDIVVTTELPILMYHRVVPTTSPALGRYAVTPDAFEEQLRYLRDTGYRSVSLDDWFLAMRTRTPLPGRAVLITFDDGYVDFSAYAWPRLMAHGFGASVFLVADQIGGLNEWDQAYGEDVRLLAWNDIERLRDEGVDFGSHSARHRPLTTLPVAEIALEAARSRALLQRGLARSVKSFAYPYGDTDPVVRHLVGGCGYMFGLTCESRRSTLRDSPLALPRIEVTGSDALEDFVVKLGRF